MDSTLFSVFLMECLCFGEVELDIGPDNHIDQSAPPSRTSSLLIRLHWDDCLLVLYISSVCVLHNCHNTSCAQMHTCALAHSLRPVN